MRLKNYRSHKRKVEITLACNNGEQQIVGFLPIKSFKSPDDWAAKTERNSVLAITHRISYWHCKQKRRGGWGGQGCCFWAVCCATAWRIMGCFARKNKVWRGLNANVTRNNTTCNIQRTRREKQVRWIAKQFSLASIFDYCSLTLHFFMEKIWMK